MERRAFLAAVTGGLLAAPLAAEAQPAGKIYRVGTLSVGFNDDAAHDWWQPFLETNRSALRSRVSQNQARR